MHCAETGKWPDGKDCGKPALGIVLRDVEPGSPVNIEPGMRAFAERRYDLIIGIGFAVGVGIGVGYGHAFYGAPYFYNPYWWGSYGGFYGGFWGYPSFAEAIALTTLPAYFGWLSP